MRRIDKKIQWNNENFDEMWKKTFYVWKFYKQFCNPFFYQNYAFLKNCEESGNKLKQFNEIIKISMTYDNHNK